MQQGGSFLNKTEEMRVHLLVHGVVANTQPGIGAYIHGRRTGQATYYQHDSTVEGHI